MDREEGCWVGEGRWWWIGGFAGFGSWGGLRLESWRGEIRGEVEVRSGLAGEVLAWGGLLFWRKVKRQKCSNTPRLVVNR